MRIEQRSQAIELRADAAGRKLEGLASTFNRSAKIGSFSERVLPGAFTATLASGRDILALCDHDASKLLGRTRSGTLRLSETREGLAFSLDVPDTADGRDLLTLAQRGDIGGCSFGFAVKEENWPAPDRRELRAVELYEISIVKAWPAYPGTTVSARSWLARVSPSTASRRRLIRAL